jgi:CNT family concentrative nucleoside transporter
MGQGFLGLVAFLFIGWLLSEDRKNIDYKTVVLTVFAQIVLAFLTTRVGVVRQFFLWISEGIHALKSAAMAGTSFVFGYLGGGNLPFELSEGGNAFIFAFQPLPMVIVVSALSMLLFHWKVIPFIVKGFSFVLQKTIKVGGALGVCAAAKVFFGQTEAPLMIRPYLSKISRSELFSVMTMGMATTSVSIMVLYATILEKTIANPISHILTASIISVPAALAISRMMIPHTGEDTSGDLIVPYKFSGSMEAVSQGANDGLQLFLGILTMLIVTLSLVALTNSILGVIPIGEGQTLSLQWIFGHAMAPVSWLMGIPWSECIDAGNLIGTKTVLNEVMAFIGLTDMAEGVLSPRTDLMMTYALCGFANFSSIGIQIGGIGAMVPERKPEIIALGFRAMIAGTIASCMSGTIIGILWWFS